MERERRECEGEIEKGNERGVQGDRDRRKDSERGESKGMAETVREEERRECERERGQERVKGERGQLDRHQVPRHPKVKEEVKKKI